MRIRGSAAGHGSTARALLLIKPCTASPVALYREQRISMHQVTIQNRVASHNLVKEEKDVNG